MKVFCTTTSHFTADRSPGRINNSLEVITQTLIMLDPFSLVQSSHHKTCVTPMNHNLVFCKGTLKNGRWRCQPHLKRPKVYILTRAREMTRMLWFLLSAKGRIWFDSVFKAVHPELPRGWTLFSRLCCAGRQTLRVIYGGSGLACSGMRMACPLTTDPTTRRDFCFSALPFSATCRPPTGPSSHSTRTFSSFLRLQQEHVWMLGAFVHIFLDSLQKEKGVVWELTGHHLHLRIGFKF